ncbi:MAG: iron-containing alcohol dehydrogenase [Thermoplasmata archaeon]
MWFFRIPEIVYGEDSVSYLESSRHRRFLIVTDRNISRTVFPDLVKKNLPPGSSTMLFSDIGEEPAFEEMTSSIERIKEFAPDCIIALGGGSVMDSAKVIAFTYANPAKQIYDLTPLEYLEIRKKVSIIAIPTTSGTGSECSWAAVVSENDGQTKRKMELASTEILPETAILDPIFVTSLPPRQTVSTAVDAIVHAIEAYTSQWRNPYSDAMAIKALQMITSSIKTVIKEPSNIECRNNVHIGASMAGSAFSNSQIGLAHAMGHALGSCFRIAHGNAVGLYMPEVIKFNNAAVPDLYKKIRDAFPVDARKKDLYGTIRTFFAEIGQPLSIQECGIDTSDYEGKMETLVKLSMESTGSLTNAREADSDSIRRIMLRVMRS